MKFLWQNGLALTLAATAMDCKQYTYCGHVHAHVLHRLVVRVYSRTLTPAWFKSRSTLSACRPKTFTPHRAMSHITPHLATPSTGTPSSLVLIPSFSEHKPCGDPRPQLSNALVEPRPFTDYEPKQLAKDRDCRHFTGVGQFTEHEDLRVKPLSFHQSITASTYDSAKVLRHRPEVGLGR